MKLPIWEKLLSIAFLVIGAYAIHYVLHDTCKPGLILQPRVGILKLIDEQKERSSKWPALRKHFLEAHPYCAYCGARENLQVHHIRPFHLDPTLELDPTNLIVLCETPGIDHHLHIGHLGNFRSEGNPNVKEDCAKHEAEMKAAGTWPKDAK
jgi:5-methylcytosine-specific restriction endonuclease McrA